jgi:hypothetical protein
LLQILLFFSGLIGLWVIWNDVLPAMQVLEDIRLWSYSVEVEGVTKVVPITLTKVLLAILIAIITFVGARNLPGVLEITLLKYLPLDAGARYAFSTICQYVVSGIGVIITFNYMGINWGSLKWLVAALGVGIGFGLQDLQEIIANFVSGLPQSRDHDCLPAARYPSGFYTSPESPGYARTETHRRCRTANGLICKVVWYREQFGRQNPSIYPIDCI